MNNSDYLFDADAWRNSVEVGPNRDLVADLATSIRNRTTIRFGLYHSLFEWFNTLHLQDAANNYTTQDFVRVINFSLPLSSFLWTQARAFLNFQTSINY